MSAAMLSLVNALAALIPCSPCDGTPRGSVRVTVAVVLASTTSNAIDAKLESLAREVKKRNPSLTGFSLAATRVKSIPVGESYDFELVEKATLNVKAQREKDAHNRIRLTIRPPELGEITYACTCDKFFPVVTPYKTEKGDHLIVAVMAKPCTAKKD